MRQTDNIRSPQLGVIAAEGVTPISVIRPSKSLWMGMRLAYLPAIIVILVLAMVFRHPAIWVTLPGLIWSVQFITRLRGVYVAFWPGGITARLVWFHFEALIGDVAAVGLQVSSSSISVVLKDGSQISTGYAPRFARSATRLRAQEQMHLVRGAYAPMGVEVWTDRISDYQVGSRQPVRRRIREFAGLSESEVAAQLLAVGLFFLGQFVLSSPVS